MKKRGCDLGHPGGIPDILSKRDGCKDGSLQSTSGVTSDTSEEIDWTREISI